jgi:hypothetical protein
MSVTLAVRLKNKMQVNRLWLWPYELTGKATLSWSFLFELFTASESSPLEVRSHSLRVQIFLKKVILKGTETSDGGQ